MLNRYPDKQGNLQTSYSVNVEQDNGQVTGNLKVTKEIYYVVVEHTKAYNNRNITLIDSAKKAIELIQKANVRNGYNDESYLFVNKKGRMH